MNVSWLIDLFTGSSVAQAVLMLSITILSGALLGKVTIAGISLGVTWILFAGIVFGHFSLSFDESLLHFLREFGLILFVFSIGMQVGPTFFSSFKKGGFTLNLLAMAVVLVGVLITVILIYTSDVPGPTMVGILSGAVTNTPGLGAAQQAAFERLAVPDATIASGYAIAYPGGVIGTVLGMIILRSVFRVSLEAENRELERTDSRKETQARKFSLQLQNPSITGKTLEEVTALVGRRFVCSRLRRADGTVEVPNPATVLEEGDRLLIVTSQPDLAALEAFIGKEIGMTDAEWDRLADPLIIQRINVTESDINGRSIGELKLRNSYGVNVTRVTRAGVDLVANAKLTLQLGDRITAVGTQAGLAGVERILGNSPRRLREPNLIPIFIGIASGILLGSIPFTVPGIPQPVKLGLAGGPLIVALFLSRFGPGYKLVTYSTTSANFMLREIGISLFLACVGLGAGSSFLNTIVEGGYVWIGYGLLITMLPLMVVGAFARLFLKVNYFTLVGLLAGSMTDPPALSYANSIAGHDAPAISYATVYPLTMFLRVISAQMLVLFFL